MTNYNGQCGCGAVKFETAGDPLFTQHCHCEKCREIAALSPRDTDKSGYSFTAAYLTDKFNITQGKNHLETVVRNSSDLFLCGQCKSLIYGISQDPNKQGGIGVNVSNFDFGSEVPKTFKPDKHIWYENRIVDIDDQLPKYKDAPKEQFGSGELIE
jgi:hypothetical protein